MLAVFCRVGTPGIYWKWTSYSGWLTRRNFSKGLGEQGGFSGLKLKFTRNLRGH